jgi:hypothetical protein
MVPSDLISSLALRGHAPHRASQSIVPCAPPGSSPTSVFATRRINAFRHAACCYRSGPVARNGLSLACNSCSFSEPPFQGQRFRPATSRPTAWLRCPFGFPLRHRFRFAPVSGSIIASIPLQRFHAVRATAPTVSTPLRDCYVPPDQSVQPPRLPLDPPSGSARFPIAPQRLFYS